MASFKGTCVTSLLLVTVVGLVLYGYGDYQRRAVIHYFQSEPFFELMAALPAPAEGDPRVFITLESGQVTVCVHVRTKEEYDEIVRVVGSSHRPRIECVILVWKGIEHRL